MFDHDTLLLIRESLADSIINYRCQRNELGHTSAMREHLTRKVAAFEKAYHLVNQQLQELKQDESLE